MTLTEFLLARIAEDEELMREDFLPLHPWFAARILGAFKAKRRIVERLAPEVATEPEFCRCLSCMTLLDFASSHTDHPDYREEWAV